MIDQKLLKLLTQGGRPVGLYQSTEKLGPPVSNQFSNREEIFKCIKFLFQDTKHVFERNAILQLD